MNRIIFGVPVELNTLIPLQFRDEDSLITQLDYTDAIMHTPFSGSLLKNLKDINIRSCPAKLDHWVVNGKGEYVGAWSKRFSKYVKKSLGVNLEPSDLSIVSESLQRSIRASSEPLIIEFTDHANWRPGEFGDGGSCWFGGAQDSSRHGLIKSGGGAIRIYTEKEEPRARLWYAPVENNTNAVLFNIYDKRNTLTMLGISRLLAMKYGVSYKRLTTIHMPDTYLNGGESAFVVGHPLLDRAVTLTFAQKPVTTDFSIFMPFSDPSLVIPSKAVPNDDHVLVCADCGYRSDENDDADDFHAYDGGYICDSCYDNNYGYCEDCDEVYHNDSISYYEELDRSLCENCIDNYDYCDSCEQHFHEGNGSNTHDGWRCSDCLDDYSECEHCNELFHNDDIGTTYDDNLVCTNCADRHYTMCDKCSYYAEDVEEVHDGNDTHTWCPTCVGDHSTKCEHCEKLFDGDPTCDCAEEVENED